MNKISIILCFSYIKDSKEVDYDFTSLDRLIDSLHRNKLYPSFELMGNPSNYFHNFKIQFQEWSNLLKQIVIRYSGKKFFLIIKKKKNVIVV